MPAPAPGALPGAAESDRRRVGFSAPVAVLQSFCERRLHGSAVRCNGTCGKLQEKLDSGRIWGAQLY